MNTYQKLSIVIPAYNEEKTIEELLAQVVAADLGIKKEIIIINDCSKDSTVEKVNRFINQNKDSEISFVFLENEKNLGKSQTVKKGILKSTGDLVVVQDADLEYDPAELAEFVELFMKDEADLVYGNRFGKKNKVIYWQNWFGNRLLSFLSSLHTYPKARMWTYDMEVCYKMCRGDIFREIGETIESTSGFGLEPELTAKFAKYKLNGKRLRFKQIPISYTPRSKSEGKHMSAWKDGLKALWEITKFNLGR